MTGVPKRSLRTVALFEAAKGVLVLVVGCGALTLLHSDLEASAEQIVQWSHLNPASEYPRIFVVAMSRLTDSHLWWLATGTALYSTIRFAEAFGLWRDRLWASWLGALSGGIYLPVEIYQIAHKLTLLRILIFLINATIVAVLGVNVWFERRRHDAES
jgi:uncharacterized membrane protein (DUF2068 family)